MNITRLTLNIAFTKYTLTVYHDGESNIVRSLTAAAAGLLNFTAGSGQIDFIRRDAEVVQLVDGADAVLDLFGHG